MSGGRQRGSRAWAVLILMLSTIRRLVIYRMKPVDMAMLGIEIAVLLMIIWGWDVISYRDKRKANKRAAEVEARSNQIRKYRLDGLGLWNTVPGLNYRDHNKMYADIKEWEGSVQSWIMDTNRILQGFSPPSKKKRTLKFWKAAKVDQHETCPSTLASATFLDDAAVGSGTYDGIPQQAMRCYRTLNHRLMNLRAILENPDRYF